MRSGTQRAVGNGVVVGIADERRLANRCAGAA
jgi:hypothetical protein